MKIACLAFFVVLFGSSAVCYGQSGFPLVTHYEAPTYPPAAKAVHATGLVAVLVEVDERGNPSTVQGVAGHPLLRQAGELAAKNWRFSPVEGRHYITVRFTFVSPRRGEKAGYVVVGPYSIRVWHQYFEVVDTREPVRETT